MATSYLKSAFSLSVLLFFSAVTSNRAQDQAIYTDSLQNSWANWSWDSTINFGNTSPVHSGSSSIAITITNGWVALFLEHAGFDSTPYTNLTVCRHEHTTPSATNLRHVPVRSAGKQWLTCNASPCCDRGLVEFVKGG